MSPEKCFLTKSLAHTLRSSWAPRPFYAVVLSQSCVAAESRIYLEEEGPFKRRQVPF